MIPLGEHHVYWSKSYLTWCERLQKPQSDLPLHGSHFNYYGVSVFTCSVFMVELDGRFWLWTTWSELPEQSKLRWRVTTAASQYLPPLPTYIAAQRGLTLLSLRGPHCLSFQPSNRLLAFSALWAHLPLSPLSFLTSPRPRRAYSLWLLHPIRRSEGFSPPPFLH